MDQDENTQKTLVRVSNIQRDKSNCIFLNYKTITIKDRQVGIVFMF